MIHTFASYVLFLTIQNNHYVFKNFRENDLVV